MRVVFILITAIIVIAACSAPTRLEPTSERHAIANDDTITTSDDEVCLPADTLVELVAHHSTPGCDAEVVVVEAPATECPEPEIIADPDACQFRPTFAIAPTATAWDTTSEFSVLSFGVAAICRPLTAETVNVSFHRVEDGRAPEQDICTVFDCDAGMRLIEHVTGGDQVSLAGGISGAWMGGHLTNDGGSYMIPVGEVRNFILFGILRADAPPGRYRFHLEDFVLVDDADQHYNFPGYPALGPEVVVPEYAPTFTHPWVRSLHLAGVRTGEWDGEWIRMFLAEVNATPDAPVDTLHFRLMEVYRCGDEFIYEDVRTDLCSVLDCSATRVAWTTNDGDFVGEAMLTDGTLDFSDWRNVGFFLDVTGFDRPGIWTTVIGRVRDDAPADALSGRFFLEMIAAYFDHLDTGLRDYAHGGTPLAGVEFDIGDGPIALEYPACASGSPLTATDVSPEGF